MEFRARPLDLNRTFRYSEDGIGGSRYATGRGWRAGAELGLQGKGCAKSVEFVCVALTFPVGDPVGA